MVFIYHIVNSKMLPAISSPYGSTYEGILYFLGTFRYGVEIFFMISGYVIVGSLRRHANLKNFLIDRAIRIFPTWMPIVILLFLGGIAGYYTGASYVAGGLFDGHNPWSWFAHFFTNLLFMPPVIPVPLVHPAAWSLSYECCFYLIASMTFFAFYFPKGKKVLWVFAGIFVLMAFNTFPRALFFVPGVLAAMYEKEIQENRRGLLCPTLGWVSFLLLWRGTGADPAEAGIYITDWLGDERGLFIIPSLLAGTYMFFTFVAQKGFLSRILNIPFMQFYGNVSYAFYLWSPIVMMVCKVFSYKFVPEIGIWGSIALFTISSFIISTIVSWLNWRIIEKGLAAYLKKWLGREGRKTVRPASAEA